MFAFVSIAILTFTDWTFGASVLHQDIIGAVDVLHGLQWTFGVRLLSSQRNTEKDFMTKFKKEASKRDIFVITGNQTSVGQKFRQKVQVLFHSENINDFDDFLDILKNGDYPNEGVLLLTHFELNSTILNDLKTFAYSRSFFHHELGTDPGKVTRFQTFRDQNLLQNVWRRNEDLIYDAEYDFQGAKMSLIGTAIDFPYFYPIPCADDPALACHAVGADIGSLDVLTAMFNFTLRIHIRTDNDWGMAALNGTAGEANAVYGGVYQSIIDGEYDRPSTAFIMTLNRYELFDFSIEIAYMKLSLMMDLDKATRPDWTLYLRPFNENAWRVSFLALCLVVLTYYGIALCLPARFESHHSLRMVAFCGWLCYLLVEIHYEGALTMFFTTERDPPFKTVEEALSMYPDYKLLVWRGYEHLVVNGAQSKDQGEEWRKHKARMAEDPELVQENRLETLEALRTPGRFVVAVEAEMRASLEHFPVADLNLESLFPVKYFNDFFAVIYPKRSPWKKALDIGYRRMLSTGQMQHIVGSSLARTDLVEMKEEGKETLDIRQTSLVFTIFGTAVILALMLFAFEMIMGRSKGIARILVKM